VSKVGSLAAGQTTGRNVQQSGSLKIEMHDE